MDVDMRVAITFIGTNKYLDFLPKYYENIEKYFLPNTEKTILVFTDGELDDTPDNITVYHQEHLPWPFITLKRFEILNKARKEIEEHDLLVFIDADGLVVDQITEEEFFVDKPLFGVHHPCHFLGMPPHNRMPGAFETNTRSRAYLDLEKIKPKVYYQGCLWGGKVPEVCDMMDTIMGRTNLDLEDDIIAVWHDETHINKYLNENQDKVHTFGPEFAYPECFSSYCNFEPRIVHLAKDNSAYQQ